MEETKTILGGGDNAVVDDQTLTDIPAEQSPAEGGNDGGGSFDFSGMIDAEGFFADNWKEGLPEDLRNEPCLDNIKNFATLTKSYVNSQKMIGRNKIALPGENATEDEINAFYSALGRPEKAEDYKHDQVKLPEGITLDEAAVAQFRDFAFKNGLSQDVFEQALAFDIQRAQSAQAARIAAHNQEYDATMAKLQQQYGDQLPARIAQVDKTLSTFGIKEIFVDQGLVNNYQIFEALANIGSRISESRLKDGETATDFKTPKQQVDEIYADPNNPIYHMDHPGHDQAVAQVKRLMAQISQQ